MTQNNLKPRVLAMVLAGGEGTRLAPLTLERSKPAVPFDYVVVRRGARLKRVIVDRYNTIDAHCRIDYDNEADRRRWFVNDSGIVVVAKGGYGAVTDRYH